MAHTILLVQPGIKPETRTYSDYESVGLVMVLDGGGPPLVVVLVNVQCFLYRIVTFSRTFLELVVTHFVKLPKSKNLRIGHNHNFLFVREAQKTNFW